MSALRNVAVTAAMAGAVTGSPAGPVLADPAVHERIEVNGPSRIYDAAYSGVRTKVVVVPSGHTTTVTLDVSGFPKAAAGKHFGTHVHQKACGPLPADAGPHYQNPGAGAQTPLRDKEVWLDFTVDEQGRGHSRAVRDWLIRPGQAGSVVIHAAPTDPATGEAGDRLVCTTVPFGS
ncbi:superoxide dismutase family protein [Actinomadura scrupuli]|uniref:superoxide dismutase family protein n=1 Tax=Actinomadura scrupuli TaxID=559629 RepID=UPI003D982302